MNDRYVKFVRYEEIEDHHRLGWMLFDDPLPFPHGKWSVGMRWVCECECVNPVKDATHDNGFR